ncbi:hypothetical protein TWF281_007389 [Arthrobotrys megalospora]
MAPTKVILAGVLMSPFAFVQTLTSATASIPYDVQTIWGLCGGRAAPTSWTRTLCEPGITCVHLNSFYWQCLPPTAIPTTTTTKSTSVYLPPTTTAYITTTASRLQSKFGQCGGVGWLGPTVCTTGSACSTANPYFAQCL